MISMVMLLLLMGLIVFGPKKTIEMAQSAAQALAKIKQATSEYQSSLSPTDSSNRDHLKLPSSENIL
jgi:Sec-independent protein translocase protein TatA